MARATKKESGRKAHGSQEKTNEKKKQTRSRGEVAKGPENKSGRSGPSGKPGKAGRTGWRRHSTPGKSGWKAYRRRQESLLKKDREEFQAQKTMTASVVQSEVSIPEPGGQLVLAANPGPVQKSVADACVQTPSSRKRLADDGGKVVRCQPRFINGDQPTWMISPGPVRYRRAPSCDPDRRGRASEKS